MTRAEVSATRTDVARANREKNRILQGRSESGGMMCRAADSLAQELEF
jgi:hypothetical protein